MLNSMRNLFGKDQAQTPRTSGDEIDALIFPGHAHLPRRHLKFSPVEHISLALPIAHMGLIRTLPALFEPFLEPLPIHAPFHFYQLAYQLGILSSRCFE